MAKREVFIDDLTGETFDEGGGRTVVLSMDEEAAAVDLTNENIDKLRVFLDPYFKSGGSPPQTNGSGRRGSTRRMPTPRTADNRDALREIRKWAKRQGYNISERGRIPYSVMDAYTKAHLLNR